MACQDQVTAAVLLHHASTVTDNDLTTFLTCTLVLKKDQSHFGKLPHHVEALCRPWAILVVSLLWHEQRN